MTTAEQNYNAGASHRAEVLKEINANKLNIDRNCFKKLPNERVQLQTAQMNFKNSGNLRAWNERNRPGNNKN